MMPLSDDKQVIFRMLLTLQPDIERYLKHILNINNHYFDIMISQIYPSELQLNKANTSHAKAVFLDLTVAVYLLDFFSPVFSFIYC